MGWDLELIWESMNDVSRLEPLAGPALSLGSSCPWWMAGWYGGWHQGTVGPSFSLWTSGHMGWLHP